MTYRNDSDIIFCTLAIGAEYNKKVCTLIQSVLKFTASTVYIVTDDVAGFGNYYGNRLKCIDFNTINTHDYPVTINGIFNYNLKSLPITYCIRECDPETLIYMDADSFLFGWSCDFERTLNSSERGVFARYRQDINHIDQLQVVKDKLSKLTALDVTYPLIIENIIMLRKCSQVYNFINIWEQIIQLSLSTGCTPYVESVEFGIAAFMTQLPIHTLNYRPYSDDFRTLHHNKIHIPLIF